MSGFEVKPSALRGYAKSLGGAQGKGSGRSLETKYFDDACSYVDDHVRLSSGNVGVVLGRLKVKIDDLCGQLQSNYRVISARLGQSATGLNASAKEYGHTDHAQAEQLDKVYKPRGVPKLDDDIDMDAPRVDPVAALVEPGDDAVSTNLANTVFDDAGFWNLGTQALKILKFCGIDVTKWVDGKLLGDFSAVAKSKNALKNLAEFDRVAATDVADGAQWMLRSWRGNAATGAHGYFDKLANALDDEAKAIDGVVGKYEHAITVIVEGANTIQNALSNLLDADIKAVMFGAVDVPAQGIPVVDVLGDLYEARRVEQVTKKVYELYEAWNNLWAGARGVQTVIDAIDTNLTSFDIDARLPRLGYYNASQGGPPAPGPGHRHVAGVTVVG